MILINQQELILEEILIKATEILMAEHEVIKRVISALEAAAAKLDAGEAVRPGFFIDAADFIKGFADGCHHVKEEQVLFKTMGMYGIPVQGGPIGMMLYEHEQGRVTARVLHNIRAGACVAGSHFLGSLSHPAGKAASLLVFEQHHANRPALRGYAVFPHRLE